VSNICVTRPNRCFAKTALFLLSASLVLASGARSHASGGAALIKQIKETMAKVRSDKTVDARTEAAEHLAGLTQKISSKEVTEALVTDITSLLDSPDDSVRYWVATALGNLGPAAKAAAPKLEEMLPKADCVNGAITSASGIRYALIKMGIKPPSSSKMWANGWMNFYSRRQSPD
jgi:HEAT repeat protein